MTELDKKIFTDIKNGLSRKEIQKKYNVSKSFVQYRLSEKYRNAEISKEEKKIKDNQFEEQIKQIIGECSSLNEVCSKLGLKGVEHYYKKIQKIINKYKLDTKHFQRKTTSTFRLLSDEEYFSCVKRDGASTLKRLILTHLKERKCEKCGLSEWQGQLIPLEVHHINGMHNDNRLENLQILCRNCHALTDNFCKKKNIIDNKI